MTDTPQPSHRPGEWPVPRTFLPATNEEHQDGALRNRTAAVQARWSVTLGAIRSHLECPHCHPQPGTDHDQLRSIRAHLNEQPNARTVRTATRRWIAAIIAIQDDIIRGLK